MIKIIKAKYKNYDLFFKVDNDIKIYCIHNTHLVDSILINNDEYLSVLSVIKDFKISSPASNTTTEFNISFYNTADLNQGDMYNIECIFAAAINKRYI